MKNTSNLRKIASISLAFLISASYAANAMEGKEEDKELTARIRAEVARVLDNFQHNMNAYYARTRNPKRITIAEEYSKKQAERTGGEEPLMPPRKKLDSSNSNNTTVMTTTTFLPVKKEEKGVRLNEDEAAEEAWNGITWVPAGKSISPSFSAEDIMKRLMSMRLVPNTASHVGHHRYHYSKSYNESLFSFINSQAGRTFVNNVIGKLNGNMVPNDGFNVPMSIKYDEDNPTSGSNKNLISLYIYGLLEKEVQKQTAEKLATAKPLLDDHEIQETFRTITWNTGTHVGTKNTNLTFTSKDVITYVKQNMLDIYCNDLFSSLASEAGRAMIGKIINRLHDNEVPQDSLLEQLQVKYYWRSEAPLQKAFVADFSLKLLELKAKSKLAASPAK